ncbi:methyltransferase family protein [Rubrivivax albus]|uniref:Isoprenylcysteine carboxylmethyltransferase family protein n=1 Tax=Rubrivivax albus TaxID=2499835 RepID=A0A3S2TJP3_9BURK|nr:isoprenylcysteine carboxylmethyltransferase family protein [Rubrivivax albus]RVT48515.1 isoprenylcysteine carboxylmethyltransferase family protein [Rubrivivax albus]
MVGAALVAAQFGLLAVLAGLALAPGRWPQVDAGLLLAAGVVLGLWALSANRPGNFNIRPQPRDGAVFVHRGPYRWVRHPMYSALLLAGLGAVRMAGGGDEGGSLPALGWVAWLVLLGVLWLKSSVEERALLRVFDGYAAYRQRSGRFLPGL